MNKRDKQIELIKNTLKSSFFINQHKSNSGDFTRMSTLKFPTLFLLILRKSIKSIQNVLNELYMSHNTNRIVTASAYTQARKKLKHTAFMTLNEETISLYYSDDTFKKWHGYRVCGVDASKIILPSNNTVYDEFGRILIKNQTIKSHYSCALFECRYDVLNKIALQSALHSGNMYEVCAAIELLQKSAAVTNKTKDLDIYDRGYASYEFLAHLTHHKRDYVIRCPKRSFKVSNELFKAKDNWSRTVVVKAPKDVLHKMIKQGLPIEIKIRFVRVVLDTGEIEVLATSLFDESITQKSFKALYFLRWGVEGYYHCIKGRLNLENFTGKTVESIRQDFWATILISNMETIFTEEVEAELNLQKSSDQLGVKINKSVSFNTLKNMAFDIFMSDKKQSVITEQLTELFRTGTLVQRPKRASPRSKISVRASLNYQKRERKHVF